MKYLFVDGWGDYSVITEYNRISPINPIFLQFATFLGAKSKIVFFWDARDRKFSKEKLYDFIHEEKIETIIFHVDTDNINSILHMDLGVKIPWNINILLFSINENFSQLLERKKLTNFVFNEKRNFHLNLNSFLKQCCLNIESDIRVNVN
jgi:WD40 repeat protein